MPDHEKARKAYERQLAGRTKWWSRGYRPRRSRNSGAVSVQTLNLLKRSEKMVKEQHTPTTARRKLGGSVQSTSSSPVQYSQVLNAESGRSPLGGSPGSSGGAAAAAAASG